MNSGQTNSVMVLAGSDSGSRASRADKVLPDGHELEVDLGYVLGDEKSVTKETYEHLEQLTA